jgi:choline ABC transporter permease protein
MAGILEHKLAPEAAAEAWLRRNPGELDAWFEGVTTVDGRPAPSSLDAADAAPATRAGGFEGWVTAHKIPLGASIESGIDFIKANGRGFFAGVSTVIQGSVDGVNAFLAAIPGLALILAVAAITWGLHRSIPLAAFVIAALLFIMNQGYWAATLETLALVIVSALFSTLIGVPVGIAAAHRPRLFAALRPVLDLMQTLPTFVYLIPTLVLFGLGVVPGLISTVIFAVPAPIRLTHLGISSVPRTLLEAGDAFGATPLQRLWKIELPSARQTILAGITQCIMLSLSMVVIAALVGAGGLGVPVVRALNSVQVDIGFEAGIAIVLLAIILDRISRPGRSGPQE